MVSLRCNLAPIDHVSFCADPLLTATCRRFLLPRNRGIEFSKEMKGEEEGGGDVMEGEAGLVVWLNTLHCPTQRKHSRRN